MKKGIHKIFEKSLYIPIYYFLFNAFKYEKISLIFQIVFTKGIKKYWKKKFDNF